MKESKKLMYFLSEKIRVLWYKLYALMSLGIWRFLRVSRQIPFQCWEFPLLSWTAEVKAGEFYYCWKFWNKSSKELLESPLSQLTVLEFTLLNPHKALKRRLCQRDWSSSSCTTFLSPWVILKKLLSNFRNDPFSLFLITSNR